MPKVAFKILTMLVVPVVVAMTAQTAAASNPYHTKEKARGQLWNSMPPSYGMSLGRTSLGDTMGPDATVNDPNVYRDGQPIRSYDINPHGG